MRRVWTRPRRPRAPGTGGIGAGSGAPSALRFLHLSLSCMNAVSCCSLATGRFQPDEHDGRQRGAGVASVNARACACLRVCACPSSQDDSLFFSCQLALPQPMLTWGDGTNEMGLQILKSLTGRLHTTYSRALTFENLCRHNSGHFWVRAGPTVRLRLRLCFQQVRAPLPHLLIRRLVTNLRARPHTSSSSCSIPLLPCRLLLSLSLPPSLYLARSLFLSLALLAPGCRFDSGPKCKSC